jgi:hypothetical protein
VRQNIRRHTNARVANANDRFIRRSFHGQPDFISRIGVLRRVDKEVYKDLLKSGGVARTQTAVSGNAVINR